MAFFSYLRRKKKATGGGTRAATARRSRWYSSHHTKVHKISFFMWFCRFWEGIFAVADLPRHSPPALHQILHLRPLTHVILNP